MSDKTSYRVSCSSDPMQQSRGPIYPMDLPRANRWKLGVMSLALVAVALTAASARAAEPFGPPEPKTKPFVYPDRFTVEAHETTEQAQEKVEAKRRCAKRWALAGIVGGTAIDIATTQWNQSSGYRELNPVYGKHASVGEQLLFRGVSGAFTYWRISKQARHNPAAACRTAKISAGVAFLPGVFNISIRIVQ